MPSVVGGAIQLNCCCSAGLPGNTRWQARSCSRTYASIQSLSASYISISSHGLSIGSCRKGALHSGLQVRLRAGPAQASRDLPDCVSTLSADNLLLEPADGNDQPYATAQPGSTTSVTAVQDRVSRQQADTSVNQVPAADSSNSNSSQGSSSSAPSSRSSSSPDAPHASHAGSFGVTAQQLQQLVQAGVDESQADTAAVLIQQLNQELLLRRQQRSKHHKHSSHRATGSSTRSIADPAAAAAASAAAAAADVASNGTAPQALSNGTAAAAALVRSEPEPNSSSSSGMALLPRALASALGSSLSSGLSGSAPDVAARVAAFGSNSLAVAATSSFLQLLLEAANDSTLLLLMAAGAVSLGLAASTGKEAVDFIDGAAILASVAICVTVTAVTNYQKEAKFRQLNSLKENIPVRVMRGGVELTLSCFDLLVGDVLLVEAGDILPADGLLFAGGQIKVDESHLTGESDDVVKEPPSDSTAAAAAGNNGSSSSSSLSSCLCMSGSKVLEGFGRMLVLAVGPNSQQGMIQQMVLNGTQQQQAPPAVGSSSGSSGSSMLREATPLMSRLEDVASSIGGVGLAAAAAVLAVNSGLYTAELWGAGLSPWSSSSLEEYLSFFITSMTLLVVAVPEGLPLAVTLALAFSVQRMLSDNNLVRNLASCETMAAATAICSDKTGTLTENNMAVVKLVAGGATFNVRPSANATATAAATPSSSRSSSRQGSPFGVLTGSSSGSSSSIRSPTLRITSSIAVGSSSSEEEEEGESEGGAAPLPRGSSPAALQQSASSSQNGSSSSSSNGSNGSSAASVPSSAVVSTASADALSWAPAREAARRKQKGAAAAAAAFRPDVLTMVSLSLDGDVLDQMDLAAVQQQQLTETSGGSTSGSDSELLTATASYLGALAAGAAAAAGGAGSGGGVAYSRRSPRLLKSLTQLLADSISLNSTASIRLVDAADGGTGGGSSGSDGGSPQQQAVEGSEALACAVGGGGSSRQLDRSGNRTECALLEFGGRLEGRLLPGCASVEQQRRVLQVFPFSSSRKRMSSLVASGPPVVMPGSGVVGQQARLYVKGAAELLLDSCRLQVALDGSLVPLPPDQVQLLKARCGRGGLRVLALAYKDMLLPPADTAAAEAGNSAAAVAGGADASQQQQQQQGGGAGGWRLLEGDDDQCDLVLIGLLALEDPVRAEVPGAIKDCQRAGIAVRMITGDNAATAAAIAASCGILPPQLAQEIEEQRLAAAASSNGGSSHNHQQQQVAEIKALLPVLAAEQSRRKSGSNGGSSSSDSSSWLDSVLHGLGGGVSGRADPDAGAALMSSVSPDPRLAVLEGPVFRALVLRPDGSTDLEAFAALWPHMRVMARCTPADKFTLVQAVKALRARGELLETIAVTGDGTNDAPALNAADVGFAMAAGTSIAKDASDILLLDNNFRSIVSAVRWGRNVYSSVTKFLQFQLTANVVALVTAAGGALALRSSPLSAVQMLWVNLIMDSLASLALATEAPTDTMLDEPPRVRDGPIITPTVAKSIIGQAALQLGVMAALLGPMGEALTHTGGSGDTAAAATAAAAVTLAAGLDAGVGLGAGAGVDRIEQYTLVFNSFVLMQLFNQVNCRKIHDEPNVLEGLSQQKLFLLILGLELGLQVAIVQVGGRAFSTVPLSGTQWAVCVGFGGLTLLLRQLLRTLHTEPPSSTPPAAGGDSSGDSSSGGRRQQRQQGVAAGLSSAAAAVGAAVAAPVVRVRALLEGAAAAVEAGATGAHAAAKRQQQQHQPLRRQPARR